jgi:hypothetical protein
LPEAKRELDRLIGRVERLESKEIGAICMAAFPSIFGGGSERVPIDAAQLEAAGISPEPGSMFFAWGNLGAETPEEVQPVEFEPAPKLDPNDGLA